MALAGGATVGEAAELAGVSPHTVGFWSVSTIASLLDTGHLLIAGLLALFSVVVPVGKLVLSLIMMWVGGARLRKSALRLVELVGRWSMTDVFVVAVLLAFLAADTEQLTDATLGAGLYFFAGYGILSLAAGHLMLRHERAFAQDED